jgi:hypothetical protein
VTQENRSLRVKKEPKPIGAIIANIPPFLFVKEVGALCSLASLSWQGAV